MLIGTVIRRFRFLNKAKEKSIVINFIPIAMKVSSGRAVQKFFMRVVLGKITNISKLLRISMSLKKFISHLN